MPTPRDTHNNLLLASLPPADAQRLHPLLEQVHLQCGQVLYEPGMPLKYVYFPTGAVVSLQCALASGHSAEIATVGNEGLVGVTLFMGGGSTVSRALVQSTGCAVRLSGRHIQDAFARGGALPTLLLRYTQALITQLSQTAVCNRLHSLDQRLCRWLLLGFDRMQGGDLVATHEFIASMLGVRREGVTETAAKLQRDGLIRYGRGRILPLDRAALERRACECYGVVKNECERLLPRPA